MWAFLLSVVMTTGCYDDSALWREIKDHEARLVKLELFTEQFNTNMSSLQSILDALNEMDYATNVSPVERNGKEVGFVIEFAKKNPVTIYFGEVSVGDLGGFPEISIAKDSDGNYYWTLNGVWIIDDSGNKIPASGQPGEDGDDGKAGKDGITPKVKIQDNTWYVSYDNGITWEPIGNISAGNGSNVSGSGSCVFSDVKVGENSVTLTLTDGTEIVVPKKFKVAFVVSEPKMYSAVVTGVANPQSPDYEVGVYYSTDSKVQVQKSEKVSCVDFDEENGFSITITGLKPGTTYYWRSYVSMYGDVEYGDVKSFKTADAPDKGYVSSMTAVMTDIFGTKLRTFYEYGYDDQFRVVSFDVFEEYYGDRISCTLNYGAGDSFELTINREEEDWESSVACTATMNNECRVTDIVSIDSDGKSTVSIKYLSDGKQDKASYSYSSDGYNYGMDYKYSYYDGALSALTFKWYDEPEEDTIQFELDEVYAHRYPAGNINVNLNLLLLYPDWYEPYFTLSHLGHCGTMLGNYLMEMADLGMGAIKEDLHVSETMDKNYREHFSKEKFEQVDELSTIEYQFNESSYPVKIIARRPYKKYIVEYDLVAGDKFDWSDDDWPIYEVVKINESTKYEGIVYETYECTILYVGEIDNSTNAGNENVGENDGFWEN